MNGNHETTQEIIRKIDAVRDAMDALEVSMDAAGLGDLFADEVGSQGLLEDLNLVQQSVYDTLG